MRRAVVGSLVDGLGVLRGPAKSSMHQAVGVVSSIAIVYHQGRSIVNDATYRTQSGAADSEVRAREALLQYNIMVSRGIKPDVLTFTSLIEKMAGARLEWQAYRLFSQMLEMGIDPLPQTYVALRKATKSTRTKLISDITAKIEQTAQTSPNSLVQDVAALLEKEEREHNLLHQQSLEAREPPQGTATNSKRSHTPTTEEGGIPSTAGYATVHIDNPVGAWATHEHIQARRKEKKAMAGPDEMELIRPQVAKLHEDELRVYLSTQRQLRNGNHSELVERVLSTVSYTAILEMLERRHKYFRSVQSILEMQMEDLGMDPPSGSASAFTSGTTPNAPSNTEEDDGDDDDALMAIMRETGVFSGGTEEEAVAVETVASNKQGQSPREKFIESPPILYTPWGAVRKPPSGPPGPLSVPSNSRRSLSKSELESVVVQSTSGELHQLPHDLLRNYAAQFNLSWSRQDPSTLIEAVTWHAQNILPYSLEGKETNALPTMSSRFQAMEKSDAHQTLEKYEAFRIISKRTKNMQITDGPSEINTIVKSADREAKMTTKKVDEKKRREENLMNAAALRKSATEYSASFDYNTFLRDAEKQRSSQFESHIGGDEPNTERVQETVEVLKAKGRTVQPFELEKMRATPKDTSDTPARELPPWELDSASQPFNMDSGRFGNPDHGRLMEGGDGRIRLMPQHESQTRYKAATGLLPKDDQKQVLQHTVYRDAEHTRILSVEENKLQYNSYRRFVNRNKSIDQRKKDLKSLNGAPTRDPARIRTLLRAGKDRLPFNQNINKRH